MQGLYHQPYPYIDKLVAEDGNDFSLRLSRAKFEELCLEPGRFSGRLGLVGLRNLGRIIYRLRGLRVLGFIGLIGFELRV